MTYVLHRNAEFKCADLQCQERITPLGSREVGWIALSSSMNHPQASLVVQVAGKAFDGNVGPEDHVRQHAVVADRDAAAVEVAAQGMLRNLLEVPRIGIVGVGVGLVGVLVPHRVGEDLMGAGRQGEELAVARLVVEPAHAVVTRDVRDPEVFQPDAFEDDERDPRAIQVGVDQAAHPRDRVDRTEGRHHRDQAADCRDPEDLADRRARRAEGPAFPGQRQIVGNARGVVLGAGKGRDPFRSADDPLDLGLRPHVGQIAFARLVQAGIPGRPVAGDRQPVQARSH